MYGYLLRLRVFSKGIELHRNLYLLVLDGD